MVETKNLTTVEKLTLIRRLQKIKVNDVLEAVGESRQNMHVKFTRGNMKESEIRKYAEALGCKVDIIFTMPDGQII